MPGELWSGQISRWGRFDLRDGVYVRRAPLLNRNPRRLDERRYTHLSRRRNEKTIVGVIISNDFRGYVDPFGAISVHRKRFQSGRPIHCFIHLEIAQLMQCSRQKTDERKKYGHDTAQAAQTQFSKLVRSGFHFAAGLTKSRSKSNMCNRRQPTRCRITLAPLISNDPAPTPSLSKRDHTQIRVTSLEDANDFHLRAPSNDHDRMFCLVVGFNVDGNQRFANFLLDRPFKPIANVMRG